MNEEDRLNAGVLFYAEALELVEKKSRAHRLNIEYNMTFESDAEKKREIISSLLGEFGEGGVLQEPIFFHYGVHTKIGKNFFASFNFVVQDDAEVTIGDGCAIGAGAVVTRDIHPRTFAAGAQCRVVRELTDADSMRNKPYILADNRVID